MRRIKEMRRDLPFDEAAPHVTSGTPVINFLYNTIGKCIINTIAYLVNRIYVIQFPEEKILEDDKGLIEKL